MEGSQVLPLEITAVPETLTVGLIAKHNVCLWSLRCQSSVLTNTLLGLNPSLCFVEWLCVCVTVWKRMGDVCESKKKKRKKTNVKCLCPSLIPLPAFDDAIQGQAIFHWIKAFSRSTSELKWMMVIVWLLCVWTKTDKRRPEGIYISASIYGWFSCQLTVLFFPTYSLTATPSAEGFDFFKPTLFLKSSVFTWITECILYIDQLSDHYHSYLYNYYY